MVILKEFLIFLSFPIIGFIAVFLWYALLWQFHPEGKRRKK